jgi:3-oxoacid CoA-transferase A subunit
MMEHTDEAGAPRVVEECRLPTPGRAQLVVTDLAVMEITGEGLLVKELAPGWRLDLVRALTGASLVPAPGIREMRFVAVPAAPASKVYSSAAHAVADIPDGAVVMLDGFGGPGGMAHYLILALKDQGARNLTIISNTAGIARVSSFGTPPGFRAIDHSVLVENGQIRKSVASFPVSPSPSRPSPFELAYKAGVAELELVPQGTLAERIRAGGFGIAAFYTPTGAGTPIAEGKETRTIDGREYVLEHALRADYALLRAHKADTLGNLVYQGTSRNFNAVMAPAARVTVVEVDEIVEPGELDPDAVVTPGVFVQRIVRRPPGFFPYERVG